MTRDVGQRWLPGAIRWSTALAVIVTGVGIGVSSCLVVPVWLDKGRPQPPSPPPRFTMFGFREPVDFVNAVTHSGLADPASDETVYNVRVAWFAEPGSAESTAVGLRELGYRAFIVGPEGWRSTYLVMVGPYETLTGARRVETELEERLQSPEPSLVAGIGESRAGR